MLHPIGQLLSQDLETKLNNFPAVQSILLNITGLGTHMYMLSSNINSGSWHLPLQTSIFSSMLQKQSRQPVEHS